MGRKTEFTHTAGRNVGHFWQNFRNLKFLYDQESLS